MSLQFIYDNRGNTTGVFISIEEWQSLKEKYTDLQIEEVENNKDLTQWQKKVIDDRLADYYKNPTNVTDFDKTLDEIERSL
jgi:hypothetical protein